MKKNKSRRNLRIFLFILTLTGLAALIAAPSAVMTAARNALELCGKVVLPSLFPFLVLSSVFLSLGFAGAVGRRFERPMKKLFNLSGSCAAVVFIGLLSGFPVGAKTAAELYGRGECTKREAETLLAFCNNAGPAFVFGSVGAGMWGSPAVGAVLWAAQTVSALVTGLIFGRLHGSKTVSERKIASVSPERFIAALTSSVKAGASGIVNICAFIVFFAIIVALLDSAGFFSVISFAVGYIFPNIANSLTEGVLTGLIEMTTGVNAVSGICRSTSGLVITGALIGWSGVSVHLQVLSYVGGSGLSSKMYFLGKLMQMVLSSFLTFIFALIFLQDII